MNEKIEKKTIIIQGAMDIEVNQYLDNEENIEYHKNINGFDFYKIKNENKNIIISKTDIGMVNATMATMTGIINFKPDYIINQGIAGAHSEDLKDRDIVVGKECININSYITPEKTANQGSDSLEWELYDWTVDKSAMIYDGSEDLIDFVKENEQSYDKGVIKYGRIGSGDTWNKEIDRIHVLNQKYLTQCEDMESIAVYSVCKKMNVPMLGMRVISNNELVGITYNRQAAIDLQDFIKGIFKI